MKEMLVEQKPGFDGDVVTQARSVYPVLIMIISVKNLEVRKNFEVVWNFEHTGEQHTLRGDSVKFNS